MASFSFIGSEEFKLEVQRLAPLQMAGSGDSIINLQP
jgi:hypothetical protein